MKTFKEIVTYINVGSTINTEYKGTKIEYAYNKVASKLIKHIEDYNNEIEDVNIENCSVDEKGVIVYDIVGNSRQYRFTKENLRKKRKEIALLYEKWNDKEFEIVPHIVSEIPETLPTEIKDILTGFII